jgi:hypothetical protein
MIRKIISCFTGLGLVLFSVNPLNAQPDLFQRALQHTQSDRYEAAIADFRQAAKWFYQNQDYENTYISSFLADYLNDIEITNSYYSEGNTASLTPWFKAGKCLDNDCLYSLVWANPSPLGGRFGGVLILEKRLRYISSPNQGQRPVNAIIDVKLVPPLRPDEFVDLNCLENRDNVSNQNNDLIALVKIDPNRDNDEDFYTDIRQAWKVNLTNEKIESIPVSSSSKMGCINHCPGGC